MAKKVQSLETATTNEGVLTDSDCSLTITYYMERQIATFSSPHKNQEILISLGILISQWVSLSQIFSSSTHKCFSLAYWPYLDMPCTCLYNWLNSSGLFLTVAKRDTAAAAQAAVSHAKAAVWLQLAAAAQLRLFKNHFYSVDE